MYNKASISLGYSPLYATRTELSQENLAWESDESAFYLMDTIRSKFETSLLFVAQGFDPIDLQ